jgi:hypothetical protein
LDALKNIYNAPKTAKSHQNYYLKKKTNFGNRPTKMVHMVLNPKKVIKKKQIDCYLKKNMLLNMQNLFFFFLPMAPVNVKKKERNLLSYLQFVGVL